MPYLIDRPRPLVPVLRHVAGRPQRRRAPRLPIRATRRRHRPERRRSMSDTPIFDELYCAFVIRALFADLADEWGCAE